MALEWIDDPFVTDENKRIRGSMITATATVCPGQYIHLEVKFDPPNLSNHTSVQVYFMKGKTKFCPTPKVLFLSDGTVIGHGHVRGRVSFQRKKYDIAPADSVAIEIF